MGPELLRVKDLARRSNSFTECDYHDALKVLSRIEQRKHHGIVIFKSAAGKEITPASTRDCDSSSEITPSPDDIGFPITNDDNELRQQSLCQASTLGKISASSDCPTYAVNDPDELDIPRFILAINPRYNLIVYGDASFAVGDTKQSVSGFVVYLNEVPLLWGSLKQTIVVDSSCSAEYLATSIACKQLLQTTPSALPSVYRFYGLSTYRYQSSSFRERSPFANSLPLGSMLCHVR
jgi:hypothetical protein